MKRGEIWTVSGGAGYAGKPRPAVIVHENSFDATLSVTICAFTADPTEAPLLRIPVEPTDQNGLQHTNSMMVEKLTTVARNKLGKRIGRVDDETMVRLNRAMVVFLGLAGVSRS